MIHDVKEPGAISLVAGQPARLNRARGNGVALGGLKIATASGWFGAQRLVDTGLGAHA